ncbi:MAG: hypothetical protein ACKVKL_12025, partial [Pseudomonadales bacterium]
VKQSNLLTHLGKRVWQPGTQSQRGANHFVAPSEKNQQRSEICLPEYTLRVLSLSRISNHVNWRLC